MRRVAGLLAVVALLSVGCGSGNGTGTRPTASVPATTGAPATTAPAGTSTSSGVPATTARPPVTSGVKVWFLNQNHAATGQEPLYEPVDRRVTPPAIAAGALDALFAGPTAAEQAAGLRFVASGATGYQKLHIENGIAYVTLLGGCSSGGSTMTIAGEIMPTLKQFASVDHVKIFAPDGTTETPSGAVDSVPTCLEP